MSQVTGVDIPVVSNGLNNLAGVTTALQAAVDRLKEVLQRGHGVWGNDEAGQKFAKGFLEATEKLLASAGNSVTTLQQVEANLRAIVQMWEDFDKSAGRAMTLTEQ